MSTALVAMIGGAAAVGVATTGLAGDRSSPRSFGPPRILSTHAAIVAASGELGAVQVPAQPSVTGNSLAAPAPIPPSPPVQLLIPRLHVAASVEPVANTDGILQVPSVISHVGWWNASVPPGAPTGTTVIDGHVDSARAGLGALFALGRLRPGDMITLTTLHAPVTYQVYARRIYVKAAGLPANLFTSTGARRLVLISCGGRFDSNRRSYEDNVVVFASLQT